MHWIEIVPSDRFVAYMKHRIHETDRDVLTMLYQPLMGATAYSLYMTLVSMLSRQKEKQVEQTHKSLMIYTDKLLDEIFEERKKLEAIGLLKVLRKKQEDEYIHYYELQPPLTPEAFFNNELLSVFLYNRIGNKEQYLHLRNSFKLANIDSDELENITRSFDQVFKSVLPSELKSNQPEMSDVVSTQDSLEGRMNSADGYHLTGDDFDYPSFLAFMPPFVSKEELQKSENKTVILKMAFLYKMNPSEMAKVVQDAILHTDELDIGELRKQVKRRYRMNESDKPPRLGLKIQPEALRTPKTAPLTDEDKQIHYFETISPIEFMEEMGEGAKVFPGDIDIIEELMFDYKLEPGVVNVLLEYLFKMYDQKLTKNLAFKIASHWSRAKLKTVKDAMDFARNEYIKNENRQQQAKETNSKKPKGYSKQTQVKQEPLPKWMTDTSWNENVENEEEFLEAKKKVAKYREMLKKTKGEG